MRPADSSSTAFREMISLNRLPSPPGVVLRLLKLCKDPTATLEQVAETLQADASLTARVLQYANSAAVARGRPLVSVQAAVSRLGLGAVSRTALAFWLVTSHASGECEGFDYPLFWSRAFHRALAARRLGGVYRGAPPDELFTLGLLWSIGSLALAAVYPQEYADLLRAHADGAEGAALRTREQECFAIDHRAITVGLMTEWGIPERLVQAVSGSWFSLDGKPGLPAEETVAARVLAASERVATALTDTDDIADAARALVPALEALDMDAVTADALCEGVSEEYSYWAAQAGLAPARETLRRPAPGVIAPAGGPRLLLVADDALSRERLRRWLVAEGYDVLTVPEGADPLDTCVLERPAMVVAGWSVPPAGGAGLCRALRQTETGRRAFVLLLAEDGTEQQLIEAFDAGADDCIARPLSQPLLRSRLKAAERVLGLRADLLCEQAKLEAMTRELSVANRRLESVAMTDELTGLPNRRSAVDHLVRAWSAHARRGRPMVVGVLDLDHFKAVNDSLGHEAGDEVLQAVAARCRSVCRSADRLFRFGGEEFLLLAMDTGADGAEHLGRRLLEAIEGNPLPCGDRSCHMTASVGLAVVDSASHALTCWEDLFRIADGALYDAKRKGRNRVQVVAV